MWAHKTAAGEMDTVGRPLPEMQMKLVNAEGNDVTDKGKGELCVKGPSVVQKYFENEKAQQGELGCGWLLQDRDLIQVDLQTGPLYVVERVKELIKVRGFQVAPAELEGVFDGTSGYC
jgi:acyl-CoA synthetase (AMP-forming)/AMP-acid ligase II